MSERRILATRTAAKPRRSNGHATPFGSKFKSDTLTAGIIAVVFPKS